MSYEVWRLVSSITLDKALDVVKRKLQERITWKDRYELNLDQLVALLDLCFTSTHCFTQEICTDRITFCDSPIITNADMKHFEENAPRTACNAPSLFAQIYLGKVYLVPRKRHLRVFGTSQHSSTSSSCLRCNGGSKNILAGVN